MIADRIVEVSTEAKRTRGKHRCSQRVKGTCSGIHYILACKLAASHFFSPLLSVSIHAFRPRRIMTR